MHNIVKFYKNLYLLWNVTLNQTKPSYNQKFYEKILFWAIDKKNQKIISPNSQTFVSVNSQTVWFNSNIVLQILLNG